MKSRSQELLDRAILAMAAAIELYNKPGFPYRNEAFYILAINAWELVIKSKWLVVNHNDHRSLYVYEYRKTKLGNKSKRKYIKRTKSRTPFSHDIRYLSRKLVENTILDQRVYSNIEVMLEFRNNAIHFYNQSPNFDTRIHEVSAACVKNFAHIVDEWFGRSVSEFGIYLMLLAFLDPPNVEGSLLKAEEKQFLAFLDSLDHTETDKEARYSVSISLQVRFTRSKDKDAIPVLRTTDPSALLITLAEEDIRERYPWDYAILTER